MNAKEKVQSLIVKEYEEDIKRRIRKKISENKEIIDDMIDDWFCSPAFLKALEGLFKRTLKDMTQGRSSIYDFLTHADEDRFSKKLSQFILDNIIVKK